MPYAVHLNKGKAYKRTQAGPSRGAGDRAGVLGSCSQIRVGVHAGCPSAQPQGTQSMSPSVQREHSGPLAPQGCRGTSGQERGLAEALGQPPPPAPPAPIVVMSLHLPAERTDPGSRRPFGSLPQGRQSPPPPPCLSPSAEVNASTLKITAGEGGARSDGETRSQYFNGVVGRASRSSYQCHRANVIACSSPSLLSRHKSLSAWM